MDNIHKLAEAELEIQSILKALLKDTGIEARIEVEWNDGLKEGGWGNRFEIRIPRVSLDG